MMQVRDEDPAAPPAAPEESVPLVEKRSILQRLLENLVESEAELPATQAFLEARGLTSVDQLDNEGKAELIVHLEASLRFLYLAGHIT